MTKQHGKKKTTGTKKKFNTNAQPAIPGITEYKKADRELKAAMEKAMDAIDRTPDAFEAIIKYGHGPIDALGTVANNMIKIQGKFNDQVQALAEALHTLEGGLKALDLDKFGDMTLKLIRGLANGTLSQEDKQAVADMQQSLPKMLDDMLKLVDNVSKTDINIKDVLDEAKKLGDARREATAQIGLFLGAAPEVLRRFDKEYIPEAKKQFKETGDPEDKQYLDDVTRRRDDFIDRMTVLEGARSAGVIAAAQLRQMVETMEDQRKKIRDIIDNSQNEWKAMLSAAGIAAGSLHDAVTGRGGNDAPVASATSDIHKGKPVVKKPKGPQHH